MPVDWSKYPSNWKKLREKILNRAKHKCEFCGQRNYTDHRETGATIILTIAHLDHDTTHNDEDNLKALCQKCHNNYDTIFRLQNKRRKMIENREREGQMRFLKNDKGMAIIAILIVSFLSGLGLVVIDHQLTKHEVEARNNDPAYRIGKVNIEVYDTAQSPEALN